LKEDTLEVAVEATFLLAHISYDRGDFYFDEFLEEN
jgi:hypothetical protein